MLSSLSKGYGSWTAGQIDPFYGEKYVADHILPDIDLGAHRHGITVSTRSGRSTAMSWAGTRPVSRQHTEGSISLPKTYTTRKGALQLFVGPDYEEEDTKQDERMPLRPMYSQLRRQFTKQELVDLSLKLGTLERLTKSVLQFGDEDYDHEQTSVSDEKNKAIVKVLHNLVRCDTDLDQHVQPGGDLASYLRDLKSSASQRYYSDGSTYIPKSRESQELQAILRGLDSNWPLSFKQDSFSDVQSMGQFTRPVSRGPSPGPPSTPRSTYQVLSSRKVAASIKSGSYLGRPSSVSDFDGDESLTDFEFLPAADVILTRKGLTSPEFLNPDDLITGRTRRGLGYRSLTGSSIGEETDDDTASSYFEFGKRKLASKKPGLSNQGRHAHEGEGQHSDVKVKGNGDGLEGESQFMDSIVEEATEDIIPETEELGVVVDDDIESVDWEDKVVEVERQREKLLSARTSLEPNLIKSSDTHVSNADEFQNVIAVEHELVRQSSAHSSHSSASSHSSKHSGREARAVSIVSIQEYNSRPSSSSGTNTFTPISRQSPKQSASSDKQSSSNLKPDSRRASLTGFETRTKDDDFNAVNEIGEIQGIAIDEGQEISEEINDRDNNFVTQGQIHIDISYGHDEAYNPVVDNDLDENIPDITDNAGFDETLDTQVGFDDQKSYFTESEDENEGAAKGIVEEAQENVQIEETVTTNDLEKPKSPDELSHFVSAELEDKNLEDTQSEVQGEANTETIVEPEQDTVDNKIVDQSNMLQDEVEIVMQENVVGKAEEDSVLDDSTSNRGKSIEGEGTNYEAGLQTLGPLLSDALSDIGDKSAAAGKLFRPASAILSRPPSGKLSQSSSGKISRPQSGRSSGKHSRPASSGTSPKLRPSSGAAKETVKDESEQDGGITVSQTADEKVEALVSEKVSATQDLSIESETKLRDAGPNKADEEVAESEQKQEMVTETVNTIPRGRQKGIKMKKPTHERVRPGKTASLQKTDKPPVIGGYIPQENNGKDKEAKKSAIVKDMEAKTDVTDNVPDVGVPDITIEAEPGNIVDEPVKAGSDTEESLAVSTLGVETDADATSIFSELDALGLRVPTKHKKKAAKEKEKMVIPSHLEEALNRQPTRSYEALEADLEKMTELVDETLSGPTLAAVGEGLTEEELELAKQILEKKMQEARDKLDQPEKDKKAVPKKKVTVKTPKKGKGKKVSSPVDTRTDIEIEQDEIKEKQRLEKMRRDQEAKELQRKIAERKLLLKAQTDAQSARSKEIEAEMARFQQEADEIQQAEDQARDAMAEIRRKQREERETRRKADLERRKAEAIARREREKRQMEDAKKKELEMLEKIQDAEMRRRLREEEERKMYEDERLAQEKLEEELKEAQRQAEEEEERMKELERQAEEEAMQRLIEEREAAERHRRRLQEEKEAMEEAERLKLEYLQQEEQRLLEEKQRIEAEENARREQERLRLLELRRLEEEARAKMQAELEKRRADALARRDFNIENRQNKDKLAHGQGITRAWTFSYFIKWPRESYEKSMGGINPKLKRFNPRPKKQPKPASAGTEKPPENPPPT